MKHYGLTIAEGSEIINPTVASGTSFPGNESVGELFFRTDQQILYVWDGSEWDNAGGAGGLSNIVEDTTPQLGGDLDTNGNDIIFGAGDNIVGDFSNASPNLRTALVTSASNTYTSVVMKPSGTGNSSYFQCANAGDATNASRVVFGIDSSAAIIQSTKWGTGTTLPLTVSLGSDERMRFETDGTLTVGATVDYELLVTSDDDIPNKKYVDDAITAGGGGINNVVEDTTPQLGGDLETNGNNVVLGTGDSLTGDFSNASPNLRSSIVTSASNTYTSVVMKPSGTGNSSYFQCADDNDATNASRVVFGIDSSAAVIQSTRWGTGSYLPLQFQAGGNVVLEFETDGTLNVSGTTTYETLVTDDDDIPNKKYVDDAVTAGGSDRHVQFNDSSSFGGDSGFVYESDGTLNVAGTTDYEDLITSDDDIPNKKYVDDEVAAAGLAAAAQPILYEYTATAGQTTFSGADDNAVVLTYTAGELLVFKNGVLLDPSDYTATSGTSVVLDTGASLNDEVNILRFVAVERFNTLATYRYLMDTGDDTASGTDAKGNTLTYAINLLNVFLNGSKLSEDEYTATDGSSVVLDIAVNSDNNILEVTTYSTFTSLEEITPKENLIYNGNFDVWQRATSQTASDYGSDDRWKNNHSGSTKTHSRQAFTLGQTDVPGEPTYYSRTVVTSSAGAGNFALKTQKIEGVRTATGQTVTLTFWAKADASKNIASEFAHNFGTGGSPSAAVTGMTVTTHALTTSWQQFTVTTTIPSISGKTLGTDENDTLDLLFWFDAGSTYDSRSNSLGQQSGTFEIAKVRLEKGSQASAFRDRPFEQELALCQRYYRKSFEYDTAPAQNAGTSGSTKVLSNASGYCWYNIRFNPPMRATPTTTYYNPSAANTNWSNGSATSSNGSSSNVHLNSNTAGSNNTWSYLHWTCDAEL